MSPSTNEHNKDCERLLGKAWQEVHQFLDQYVAVFDIGYFNEYHRTFLHNRYGIEVVRAKWGKQAELAAIIHIVRDSRGIPIDGKSLKWVKQELGKALIYFNNMEQSEPRLDPRIMGAWDGKGLVTVALGE
jgi:hypothetical protein